MKKNLIYKVQMRSWVGQTVLLLLFLLHTLMQTALVGSVRHRQPIAAEDLHPTSRASEANQRAKWAVVKRSADGR